MKKSSNGKHNKHINNKHPKTPQNPIRHANQQGAVVKKKGKTITNDHMRNLKDTVANNIEDPRKGKNIHHALWKFMSLFFGLFFYQCVSMRMFYNTITRKKAKLLWLDNVTDIPSDNHVRRILDMIPWEVFTSLFQYNINYIKNNNAIGQYLVLQDDYLVVALDGSLIIDSNKISCDNCSTKKHSNGVIDYFHSVLGASIIGPYNKQLPPLPLPVEPLKRQDGSEKQDCERNAFYRWFDKNFDFIKKINPEIIILGDDLFGCNRICKYIEKHGCKFIFTCKFTSHPYIEEFIKNIEHTSFTRIIKNERNEKDTYNYRFYDNIPLKDPTNDRKKTDEEKTIYVNLCILEIIPKQGGEKEKKLFSFITNINPKESSIEQEIIDICNTGRTRWDIENKLFNTMKNRGYHLEHNFGHGKNNLVYNMIIFNILAYLLHITIELLDPKIAQFIKDHRLTIDLYSDFFKCIFNYDLACKFFEKLGIIDSC